MGGQRGMWRECERLRAEKKPLDLVKCAYPDVIQLDVNYT